ncbi:MaoC family dehydratase, partial [Mycobacterium tuberculosis]
STSTAATSRRSNSRLPTTLNARDQPPAEVSDQRVSGLTGAVQRAAAGPFGTTIAHGFMTLALLPRLQHQMYTVKGVKLAINYGLNKVRFPAPVPVGSRVRATSSLVGVEDLGNGTVQATVSTTVEVEGSAKPACVAESIVRYVA